MGHLPGDGNLTDRPPDDGGDGASPGWYRDPEGSGYDRWWDGSSWDAPLVTEAPDASALAPDGKRRKVAFVVVAFVVLIGAAAVGSDSPSSAPTGSAEGSVGSSSGLSQTEMDEAVYLTTIKAVYPEASSTSDGELVALGRELCEVMDSLSLQAMAVWAASNDLDPDVVGSLAGAAVPAFCPRHYGYGQ